MKTHLKLAGLTLAAQSRILKRLARSKQYHPELRKGFEHQRIHEVRKEARATHIALGFLRGRYLDEMERPYRPLDQGHISTKGMSRTAPDWARVEQLILENGLQYFENEQQLRQDFAEFKETGSVGVSQ